MKRITAIASILFSATSFAGGWLETASKYTYGGWACEPSTPSFQGWVHFWRDDNIFLGALHANGHREQAVGNLCAGNSDRGFYGTISFSDSYLDNKTHKVRAYFVRENGTNFELQGSFKNVFFDSPNPVIVNSTAIESYAVPGGPPPQTPPPILPWVCATSCNLQSFTSIAGNIQSEELTKDQLEGQYQKRFGLVYSDENGNISSMEVGDDQ